MSYNILNKYYFNRIFYSQKLNIFSNLAVLVFRNTHLYNHNYFIGFLIFLALKKSKFDTYFYLRVHIRSILCCIVHITGLMLSRIQLYRINIKRLCYRNHNFNYRLGYNCQESLRILRIFCYRTLKNLNLVDF